MDKKPIEILAEVSHTIKNGSEKSVDELERLDCILFAEEALEAMKIFGKQCFEAGRYYMTLDDRSMIPTIDFDEYLNKLEENK